MGDLTDLSQLTVVIINWRTLDLVKTCVRSLRSFYPELSVVLIDNGSRDLSTAFITDLAKTKVRASAILNKRNAGDKDMPLPRVGQHSAPYRFGTCLDLGGAGPYLKEEVVRRLLTGGNIGHGPALHQFLSLAKTPYVLSLDSDVEVQEAGWLKEMLGMCTQEEVFAVGREIRLARGSDGTHSSKGVRHIHPSVAVFDTGIYQELLPFVHSGTPSSLVMPDAVAEGYELVHYQIGAKQSPVWHKFQGSRKRFGEMPGIRSGPIMPNVLLKYLESEFHRRILETPVLAAHGERN